MLIVLPTDASTRLEYGAGKLADALQSIGTKSQIIRNISSGPQVINVTITPDSREQAFSISRESDGSIRIKGSDDSGVLYGLLDLAKLIRQQRHVPHELSISDAPVMSLRGAVIGIQKTFILPGRLVYEYPYTPELFPYFYDHAFWTEYFDFLVQNKYNALFLWNGHPFASLVKVKEYPFAIEVSDEVYEKNVAAYHHLTKEADKRGIWVVQNFYSLLVSKPFAEHYKCATQLSAPTPEACDYTRKSIAEFVKQYPNVGIMPCLGEALSGNENQKHFLNEVILPGIKDGIAAAGIKGEPPVVIRTHATDLRKIMPDALKVYKNLYTEAKYNGESLTTWEPRGVRQQVHLDMSRMGSKHMANVHILANLEPFRYGAQRFIKKCVQAARDRLGCEGLHLYPLDYWAFPETPDNPPLRQIDRDWIWFEAWGRYAWNPDIDENTDRAYWLDRLAGIFGTHDAAEHILDAFNDSGECAPRILRRYGITEGNRQTMSLGMTLDQLVDPSRYRPFEELWESQAPPGERLQEYMERELKNQPHVGETPVSINAEVLDYSAKAVDAIEKAVPHVIANKEEFERIRNDVHCIRAMSQCYVAKVEAAMEVIRFNQTKDARHLEAACQHLEKSLEHFKTLAKLTENTYSFANTMQTSQRRIPIVGGLDGKAANYHWRQLLPLYETELDELKTRTANIKAGKSDLMDERGIKRFPKAGMNLTAATGEEYEVAVGAKIFSDQPWTIRSVCPELNGLTGMRFSHETASKGNYQPLTFTLSEPAFVLIGHIKSKDAIWRKPPDLETDAAAELRGGDEPLIQNAIAIDGLPPIDVHALKYDAGANTLEPRGEGSFIVVGVIPQTTTIKKRNAGRGVQ